MGQDKLSLETHEWARKMLRIANRAAKRAQEENRKKGIPNVYDFNGHLYYELPNGELTKEDPCTARGFLDHSLKEDCAIMTISIERSI